MYTLKTPAFLRNSSSRPSSPLPTPPVSRVESEAATEHRASRPLSKLALTHFNRKPSPASFRSSTPTPLVQDASYLESLGLKLSEAATRAVALPTSTVAGGDVLNGKRPIPSGRGHAFGELITSELIASQGNAHLQRAILRLLHRPLSVLITNLNSILLPLLSSSAFLSPAAPTVQAPNPNATQAHALGVANFAAELLDDLEDLDVAATHDHRGDGLNGFREGLVSLIGRVVNPLIGGLKDDLLPLIKGLESVHPSSLTSVHPKLINGVKAIGSQHPSIASLQALMPIYTKAMTRYTMSKSTHSSLATFLISMIWRTLVSLSHRPSAVRSRSNSMSALSAASSNALKKRFGASTTPPSTPPASRFAMKLPGSRPPSPTHMPPPSVAMDARTMYDLLNMLPKPSGSSEKNIMAREAVNEAFEALGALCALLSAVDSGAELREDFDLDLLTDGLPMLIALPVLLRWSGHGEPHVVQAMLDLTESEYRDGCLSGFGRADECATSVAERMIDILRNEASRDTRTKLVVKYLESCVVH